MSLSQPAVSPIGPGEFLDYSKTPGEYRVMYTTLQLVLYKFGGESHLSCYGVEVISLDSGPARHNITSMDTEGNHFYKLKTGPLQPDQQYLLRSPTATQLESGYNRRYQTLHLKSYCEVYLLRYAKAQKFFCPPIFGWSCFSCHFGFKGIEVKGYMRHYTFSRGHWISITDRGIDASCPFSRIKSTNPADTEVVQAMKVILLRNPKISGE